MEEALQHVEKAKKERDIARDLAASLLKEQTDLKQQLQDQPQTQQEVRSCGMGVIAHDCLAFPAPKSRDMFWITGSCTSPGVTHAMFIYEWTLSLWHTCNGWCAFYTTHCIQMSRQPDYSDFVYMLLKGLQ